MFGFINETYHRLPFGTQYKVEETSESSTGYSVSYTVDSNNETFQECVTLNDNDEDDKNDLTARLGAPAGLDLEYDLSSQSLTDKLKNLHFMKMFDFDKDGELTKNDFNVAKEK